MKNKLTFSVDSNLMIIRPISCLFLLEHSWHLLWNNRISCKSSNIIKCCVTLGEGGCEGLGLPYDRGGDACRLA